jgi:hypothetical protein
MRHRPLLFPVIAAVVAGVEALLHFGVLHMSFAHVPIGALLAGALLIAGIASWVKTSDKSAIAAATVVAMVGALQLAAALHFH